jgi:hypothetical protein
VTKEPPPSEAGRGKLREESRWNATVTISPV